jgi:putative amidoligase enzyme
MPLLFVRAANVKQLRELCHYIVDDLDQSSMFGYSIDVYLRRYHNYPILSYNTDRGLLILCHTLNGFRSDFPGITPLTFKAFKAAVPPKAAYQKVADPMLTMGFEIEGCVSDEVRDDLIIYLMELYPDSTEDQLIHSDGSIRPQCRAIEIVTPPLPVDDAMERLEWLCGTLAILSEEGLFETNHTCGLHVNVSEAHSFTTGSSVARNRFAYGFLNKLDPVKWRRAFRRSRNRYCQWAAAPKDIASLSTYANHYSAINIQHLHGDAPQRRIEVRVAGGKDYHRKTERLKAFLLDIEQAACQAHQMI